jgi:iron complex transport system ATP-binding protein
MTTSVSPGVSLSGAACGYGTQVVLRDVTISCRSGEVVALLGANGSGKSTLLKTMAGAVRPISGSVTVGGSEVQSLSKKEIALRIGYVPQIESPAFDFTVREVVLMGRMPHSSGLFETRADHAAAERAMARADCLGLSDRPISELSGGEGQRVRISRALAQEAPVLLMDEPTTHLDVRHQIDIGRLVRQLAAEGMTIVVAVHDLNWAAAFASRAALLHEGRISLDGPTAETLESPAVDRAFDVQFTRVRDGGLRLLAAE